MWLKHTCYHGEYHGGFSLGLRLRSLDQDRRAIEERAQLVECTKGLGVKKRGEWHSMWSRWSM